MITLQLAYLMRYTDDLEAGMTSGQAYATAASIALITLAIALLDNPFFYGLQLIGMRIRLALCSMIYDKVRKQIIIYILQFF